jgi:hypothetical protein
MKYFRLSAFFVLITLFSACKKDKSPTEIVIEYPIFFADQFEVALDTVALSEYIVRESFAFPMDLDTELSKQGASKKSIKSAKLMFLKLQVLDYAYPDSNKYCNFKDLSEMYMDIKYDGIGQDLIASKSLIPDTRTKVLNLDMADIELKNYFQQPTIQMVFKYKKRRQMHNIMPYIIIGRLKVIADPI